METSAVGLEDVITLGGTTALKVGARVLGEEVVETAGQVLTRVLLAEVVSKIALRGLTPEALRKLSDLADGDKLFDKKNIFERGNVIENALGKNTPDSYPVVDRFANNVATSIKSLDVNASSYQDPGAITSRVTGYIDEISEFEGLSFDDYTIRGDEIESRALELVVPTLGNAAQQAAFGQVVQYGAALQNPVVVTIIVLP